MTELRELRIPYAIWWTDQVSCELAEAMGAPLDEWPPYLMAQWRARLGRNGRGRLWVDCDIDWGTGPMMIIADRKWVEFEDHPVGKALAEGACGSTWAGIVVRFEDVHHCLVMPGVVTDVDLKPFRFNRPLGAFTAVSPAS